MANFLKQFQNTVKHWYILLISGILMVFLGVYMFSVPTAAYLSLASLFSAGFFVIGVLGIFFAFQNKDTLDGWGWYLASAILDLIVGLILINNPLIALQTLPLFVGFTLLFRAMQGIGFSIDMSRIKSSGWGFLLVMNILSVIFALIVIVNPLFGSLYIVVMTAITFIFSGMSVIVLAFNLKKMKKFSGEFYEKWKAKIKELENEYNKDIKNL